MKKIAFTLLSGALAALMLTGCTPRHEAANGSKVTASPAPSEKLTEVPTETPTEEPTEAPTDEPIPKTIPYDRGEYDTLLAFFELADENGVKNGEKCFKDYDPTKVNFWGTNPEDLINTKESRLIWNDEGKLYSVVLYGLDEPPTKLVGKINMDQYSSLRVFDINSLVFDSVNEDARNCYDANDISDINVSLACEGYLSLIADYITRLNLSSFSRCYYQSTGENAPGSPKSLAFTVDLTADGSGSVGIRAYSDTHYYVVNIYAHPIEGHKFLGWYDAEGKLISAEAEIELSYGHDTGWSVHDFTGIAKFE